MYGYVGMCEIFWVDDDVVGNFMSSLDMVNDSVFVVGLKCF